MAERPIIFSAPMVNAILAGRKSQTRRVLKPQPPTEEAFPGSSFGLDRAIADGVKLYSQNDYERLPKHPTKWELIGSVGVARDAGFPKTYDARHAVGDRLWVKHAADCFPVYFRPIHGWERLYAAGTDGRIYRMDRGEPSPLKGTATSGGYLSVSLSRDGLWHTKNVHRLICEAFYGPPPDESAQVRHVDGDQTNNSPGNLDWGSVTQNRADRTAHGRGVGSEHHAAKLTKADALFIRESAESQRALARRFGVAQSTIWDVRQHLTWAEPTLAPARNSPAFQLWRSPIHMPRWASRLTLTVTDVRVQRLQDISEADAIAEGTIWQEPTDEDREWARSRAEEEGDDASIEGVWIAPGTKQGWGLTKEERTRPLWGSTAAFAYRCVWNHLHGPNSWDANPWVMAITFTAERRNIDGGG